MANPLQKRKRKQHHKKITLRKKSTKAHILGNKIIAENWNHKETLTQNYKRLGLTSKLGHVTGGVEKTIEEVVAAREQAEAEKSSTQAPKLKPGEARIVRDEEGKVIGVEYGKSAEEQLDEMEHVGAEEGKKKETGIVHLLEEQAKLGYKREREQSEREEEWIEKLVAKHGNNYKAMFWDKRLNPYQQTIGDLRKRVEKWRKSKERKAAAAGA